MILSYLKYNGNMFGAVPTIAIVYLFHSWKALETKHKLMNIVIMRIVKKTII